MTVGEDVVGAGLVFTVGREYVCVCVSPPHQNGTKVDEVTAIVKTVPGAELMSNVGTELSYRLPIQESALLPTMFATVCTHIYTRTPILLVNVRYCVRVCVV